MITAPFGFPLVRKVNASIVVLLMGRQRFRVSIQVHSAATGRSKSWVRRTRRPPPRHARRRGAGARAALADDVGGLGLGRRRIEDDDDLTGDEDERTAETSGASCSASSAIGATSG